MKKLIALGIAIAILITAFVLLPNQKSEDVIAGPNGKKDEKIETLEDLEAALMSIISYNGDIESGTITVSHGQSYSMSSEAYDGESINNANITLYFTEDAEYYQLKGSVIYRMEEDDDSKVLTYVYDIELYAEEDARAIRINFFDGYSNDSDFDPALPVDQLGVWFEVDETKYAAMKQYFGGQTIQSMCYFVAQQIGSVEEVDEDFYVFNPDDYEDYEDDIYFSIDLSDSAKPVCELEIEQNMSEMDYYSEQNETLTLSNLNNTTIEFDFDDADVKKEKAFDWDFFTDLLGIQ